MEYVEMKVVLQALGRRRVDNDVFKELESTHHYRPVNTEFKMFYFMYFQESSIKGWQGAIKTDTPNWDTQRNRRTCLREEMAGWFSHMEPELCFRLRQRSSVLGKEFGEPLFLPDCTSSAFEKRKILLLKVMYTLLIAFHFRALTCCHISENAKIRGGKGSKRKHQDAHSVAKSFFMLGGLYFLRVT